jgi:hypothetical protein
MFLEGSNFWTASIKPIIPELIRSSMEMWDGSRKARREAIYLIKGA